MHRFTSMFGRHRSRPKVDTSHTTTTNHKGLPGLSPTGPTTREIENIQVDADVTSPSPVNQAQNVTGDNSASTPTPEVGSSQTETHLPKKRSLLSLGRSKTKRIDKEEKKKKDRRLSTLLPPLIPETQQAPAPAPISNGIISEPIAEPTTVQLTQVTDVQVNSPTENLADVPSKSNVGNVQAVLRSQQDQEPGSEPEPSNSHRKDQSEDSKNTVQKEKNEVTATSSPRTSKSTHEHGGDVASGNTDQQVAITSKINQNSDSATPDQPSTQSIPPQESNNNDERNSPENTEPSQVPNRTPTKLENKKPLIRFLSKRHNNGQRHDRGTSPPSLAVAASPLTSTSPGLPDVSEEGIENPLSPTIQGRKWNENDSDNDSLFCY